MIDQERLVNAFCELVKIDSPSDEEEDVAQHLTAQLTRLGFTVERDAHGNLIASEEGADPLLLSAHMDTVEPGRSINPQVVGDRVTSDGTTILGGDCKAGVASIMEALESATEDGSPRRPVQVVFTRGEEIGLVGAANLDYSMIKCKEAVVFDGNGPVNTITGASPTYMKFDVTVTGRGAHAGVEPEKGLSAIRIASEIINELPMAVLTTRPLSTSVSSPGAQFGTPSQWRPPSAVSSAATTPRPWTCCACRWRPPCNGPGKDTTRRPSTMSWK